MKIGIKWNYRIVINFDKSDNEIEIMFFKIPYEAYITK